MEKEILKSSKTKYFFWSVISILFFILFFKLWEFDFTKPYVYNGKDDFVYGVIAKNAMSGGSYFFNSNLGAPYGMELYYFPLLMQFYIIWCKLIGIFTDNWVIAVNSYYFITYILSVYTFFYMCKKIGMKNNTISYLGGLVFAFSQYHIYRATIHITATSYFVIPLIIVLCYNMADGKYEEGYSLKRILEIAIICVLVGLTDIYYAFFGCFLVCIMIIDSIIKKHWKTLVVGFGIIIGITLMILICLAPSIMYSIKNGVNEYAASRSPYEAYGVGFQLVSLFLPLKGSCNLFSKFTDIYINIQGLPSGEQICNYVGLIGFIGLGYTVYYILFRRDKDSKQDLFIKLNFAIIFLGTVGGIGLIVAFLLTSKIRTYTRVFPYVFAFLIIAVCFLFDRLYTENKKWIYLLYVMVIVHFIDLSPWSILPNYQENARKYDADKKFILDIEKFTNEEDYILQLPYITGLENYINGIIDNCNYHFKGYLMQSSSSGGWSYGTLVGTDADTAYREKFDTDSAEQILFFAKKVGYSGIYIDVSMLEKSRQHIIQDLQERLGYVSLKSEDDTMYYFDIRDYEINMSEDFMVVYGNGFYREERYEDIMWRWSEPESTIKIYSLNEDRTSNVKIELHSFNEKMKLVVWSGNNISLFDITNDTQTITIPVEFIDGVAELNFVGGSMEYENGTSGRKLSFRINSVVAE